MPKLKYGYARVSTDDQNVNLQVDALCAAGVQRQHIFFETMSGTALERPQFKACMQTLEAGDALVVYKIDRLGRSALSVHQTAEDLRQRGVSLVVTTLGIDTATPAGKLTYGIMAQMAEFERDLIVERTKAGLAAARKRGRTLGRPNKLNRAQVEKAVELLKTDTKGSVAGLFRVSVRTLNREIVKLQAVARGKMALSEVPDALS
ncbi:MAG: recombinase family protein [Alphaproteobacteria bacterium]|nr:recombinase family protein [Alphaproteobacteria bacterium]